MIVPNQSLVQTLQASPTPSTTSTVPIGRTSVLPSPSPFGEIEAEDVESLYKDCIHTGWRQTELAFGF